MVSDLKKVLACVGLGLMVQGCETSELISSANPANWFEDEEQAEADAGEQGVPGEDEDFPAIGTVPERPATPDIQKDYEELKSGLIADKENARHTDQAIRSGAIPETPLQGSRANIADAASQAPEDPPVAASVKPVPGDTEVAAASATPQPTPEPVREKPQPAPAAEPLAASPTPQRAQTPPPSPAEPSQRQRVQQPTMQSPTGQEVQTTASTAAQEQPAASGKHIANIYFGNGQTQLTAHDRKVVGQVVALYNQRQGKSIRVVGHSSSSAGTADQTKAGLVNFKVSLDRASAVASEMVRRGVPKQAIQVDARGAAQPLYTENSKQAQAYNRRAEIFIRYK